MVTSETIMATETSSIDCHLLANKWTMWAHLPHDIDWSINSYKKIYTMQSVEEAIALTETLPDVLVKNCMLFLMKEGIKPIWEDPKNRAGGCFSYKISNKCVYEVWKELSYVLVGETISSQNTFVANVTGITISPKKNFCIIKIWTSNCVNQNPNIITGDVKGMTSQGCLFKKHMPEY
jgi:Eukaryotic initiation factor 4E